MNTTDLQRALADACTEQERILALLPLADQAARTYGRIHNGADLEEVQADARLILVQAVHTHESDSELIEWVSFCLAHELAGNLSAHTDVSLSDVEIIEEFDGLDYEPTPVHVVARTLTRQEQAVLDAYCFGETDVLELAAEFGMCDESVRQILTHALEGSR